MNTPTPTSGARLRHWFCRLALLLALAGLSALDAVAQGTSNPCNNLNVNVQYTQQGCCYRLQFVNNQQTYPVTQAVANVLNGSATVTGASGFSATNTAGSATWSFPNTLPSGTTSGAEICFNALAMPISFEIVWYSQGKIVCRDTVRRDECQPKPPTSDSCKVDTLLLNTGWNHTSNSVDPIGSLTTFWTVIGDPSPNTNEPRPAWAINKHPAWSNALPNSQWISSYPSSANDTNGLYVYQACFCARRLATGAYPNIRLVLDLRADDRARVYVNGNLVVSTPLSWAFNTPTPTHFDGIINNYLSPDGHNCITVEVDNTGNVAMGFNLAGFLVISGSNPGDPGYVGFDHPRCCNPGLIRGIKFWDQNCNGKQDAGEPPLAGWVITAQGPNGTYTDTTDIFGNYNLYVAPGTYTVGETMQPGWTQSAPGGPGTYSVTVAGGQSVSNRDFGNCRVQQKDCIRHFNDSIYCKIDPTNGNVTYVLQSTIGSLMNCSTGLQSASFVSATSTAGPISITPGTFAVSPTPAPYSFAINGSGATAGATVTLVLRVCCYTQPGTPPGDCCTDTFRFVLPDCKPVTPQDCFQIVDDTVYCKEGPNGQTIYTYCFRVKNMSNFTAAYFTLSGVGVTFSPATVILGTLLPTQTSGTYCVQITGPSANPGPLTFNGILCNKKRDTCCEERVTIKLPDCKPEIKLCCDDWTKRIANLKGSASPNGTSGVNGGLYISGPRGCERITRIDASLVSASINGQPTWGYFVPSSTVAGFGTGTIAPGTYGQEVLWGPQAPTPLWGNAMALSLRFQPMAPGVKRDTLRWCVKLRFTNECCVTCDTTLCFMVVRTKLIIIFDQATNWGHLGLGVGKGGDERGLSSAGDGISGEVVGSDSAALNLGLPSFPAEMGTGRYVGLSLRALDATLTDVSSSASGVEFFTAESRAVSAATLQPGTSLQLGLKYEDFGAQNAINHVLTVRYVLDSDVQDTLEEDLEIVLRRSSAQGGDQVGPEISQLRNVKTYALHLTNANGSQEPIDHIVFRTSNGVTVVAVGPTANDTTVAVGFRTTDNGRSVAEVRGQGLALVAGQSQAPIYLTLAGVTSGSTTIEFVTLNAGGQTISTGQVTLDSPLSGVVVREEGTGVAGALLGPSTPNPTSNRASITLRLDRPVPNASLTLTDAMGREVLRPINGESLAAGDHVVSVETAGLPAGTYFYTLRTPSGAITRTLTVAR